MEVGGYYYTPAAFPRAEKAPVTIVDGALYPPEPIWTGAESVVPYRDSMPKPTDQFLANRYTDYAIKFPFTLTTLMKLAQKE